MKKIINGKLYDTDTAVYLGVWTNNLMPTDIGFHEKSLYRTNKGQYFLFEVDDDSEFIYLYTEDEAKTFAESYLDADEYIKIFGEVEEG